MGESQQSPAVQSAWGRAKSRVPIFVRLAVGAALVAFVLSRVDFAKFIAAFVRVHLVWVLIAVIVQQSSVFVWALRWARLLAVVDMPVPFSRVLKGLFVGGFFSNIFPTSFSGDLFRGYWVLDDKTLYRKSLFVVFVDRFIGLVALGYLILPVIVFFLVRGARFGNLAWPILGVAGVLCLSFAALNPRVFKRLDRLVFGHSRLLGEARTKVAGALDMIHGGRTALLRVYAYSLVIQLSGIVFFYCLGSALGLRLGLWTYVLIVPPTVLATMFFPFSFNGLGVREAMLVMLTTVLGVPVLPAQAVALGVLVFAVNAIGALIGGAFYVIGKPVRV